MDDGKIIEILKSKKRDRALIRLYRYYPKVKKLIQSIGGTKEDAQDVFQEALVLFCKKAATSEFVLSSSIDTYLYSVCRFLWKNELKKRKKNHMVEINTELTSTQEEELQKAIEKEEKMKVTENILARLGDRCFELLKLFYHDSLSMKEIAIKMDFKSEKIAKNQKYKCIQRAKLKLKTQLAELAQPII
ncbi:MAG: sigma-70 family RNA polymerase sigma factor [Bacteroidetes bacterium]|nr:sigma-70 family RNA polymerase sigma factor [Bacteroidota bacterium]